MSVKNITTRPQIITQRYNHIPAARNLKKSAQTLNQPSSLTCESAGGWRLSSRGQIEIQMHRFQA
jgi:hypothetical protein